MFYLTLEKGRINFFCDYDNSMGIDLANLLNAIFLHYCQLNVLVQLYEIIYCAVDHIINSLSTQFR